MLTLSFGRFLGSTLTSTKLLGAPVTLSRYPPGERYPWHVHENPTFFVLLRGHHEETNHRTWFKQSTLSVVFHPRHEPHATLVGADGMVGINLEVSGILLERLQIEAADLPSTCALVASPHARFLGLRLAAQTMCGERGDEAALENIALELVTSLASDDDARPAPDRLNRALEFLEANADQPIRLSEVAAEAGLHPVYCARLFRRQFGCTVTCYLHMLRLIEAGAMILTGKRSLAEVAQRVGFADQAHFTRIWSRALSVTPGCLARQRWALSSEAIPEPAR